MYNLENLFIPTFSPIISLIKFAGLYFIGKYIIKILNLEKIISKVSILKFQYLITGIIFISFIIYPFVILNFFIFEIISFFSYLLIFTGIAGFLKYFNVSFFNKKNISKEFLLCSIIIFGYFFITLAPITNADSLDYHLGVPLYILNNTISLHIDLGTISEDINNNQSLDSEDLDEDIYEIREVLGIEAARQAIINEVYRVIEAQGLNINIRHIMLVADIMSATGAVKGITRYGVVSEKASVLARASFETPLRHMINAALEGEIDYLNSVVENVMINQPVPLGTGLPSLITKMK